MGKVADALTRLPQPPPEPKDKGCPSKKCYQVDDRVCKKNHVAIDLEILVVLGLLSEVQLEAYLKLIGLIGPDDCLDMGNDDSVKVDPLLSLDVDGLLSLDVLGPDGLLDLNVADLIKVNLGRRGEGELIDLDILTSQDKKTAPIDIDIATYKKKHQRRGGLLDVDILGPKDKDKAAIDIDLLTTDKKKNKPSHPPKHADPYFLSHYQPICKKAFKKEHRKKATGCHAQDANHCLAICHSQAALLSVDADVKIGDIANIQLCAAIEFDNSDAGDNCRYYVAPETEPCQDDQLEDSDSCYTFFRN